MSIEIDLKAADICFVLSEGRLLCLQLKKVLSIHPRCQHQITNHTRTFCLITYYPANIYILKVNKRKTTKRRKIYSRLTIQRRK